ncbi:hypothetical protein DFH06DRAFT_1037072, partial [Mycena polygramma]
MESSSIRALLFPRDVRTSPTWRPCFASSTTVLSCLIKPQDTQTRISFGGSSSYRTLPCPDLSQVHARLSMSMPIPMPARVSASPSSLGHGGAPGASPAIGSQSSGTLAGPRLSASSSSPARLPPLQATYLHTSTFTATTKVWSKGGGTAAAQTGKSTTYSAV